jgi:glycosyltransferase involved in cell wall biosynthesis
MQPIRITMLMAELNLTGTPRIMMEIVENINYNEFEISVAYKPKYHASEQDLLKDLKDMGIKMVPLRGHRLFSSHGILDLLKHLKRDNVRIVHCWDALGIVARVLKYHTRCQVIESFCNPVESKGSFLFYCVNKLTSLSLDGIIFCTHGVQDSFKQNKTIFLNRKKIALILNCINTKAINKNIYDHEEIKLEWGIGEGDIVLTNIGYFNEQKGQKYLLQAMQNILSQVPNARLVLVGWGPLEPSLRMQANELGIEKNVIFAGKCSHDAVFEILSITDLFMLSSLWEGFGLVLGEAMAMGKPIVSTRTIGSEFLVQHNETGFIVPPKNPGALAEAVIDLLQTPDLMQEMGKKGRKRVSTLFTPERFIESHEAFYREIIG